MEIIFLWSKKKVDRQASFTGQQQKEGWHRCKQNWWMGEEVNRTHSTVSTAHANPQKCPFQVKLHNTRIRYLSAKMNEWFAFVNMFSFQFWPWQSSGRSKNRIWASVIRRNRRKKWELSTIEMVCFLYILNVFRAKTQLILSEHTNGNDFCTQNTTHTNARLEINLRQKFNSK